MDYRLFTIKSVEFESGQKDPFGFENYASDRIAPKYIPFSGSIHKPVYLLFVAYVNWLLDQRKIPFASRRDRENIRIRLEKLLVRSWIRKNETLREQGVIGSTIRYINPFTGNDGNWVIQNCYKIYEAPVQVFSLTSLAETYHRDNQVQLPLLLEFLKRSGSLESNHRFLENLLEKLARKKDSLFSGNMLLHPKYRRVVLGILKGIIKSHEFGKDRPLIQQLFASPKRAGTVLRKVRMAKRYPFRELNQWFCAFVKAVDASMDGKDAPALWANADKAYQEIRDKRGLRYRPECRCWFELSGGRYKRQKDFDKEGWSAVVRRTEKSDKPFFLFRTNALASLLEELDRHAQ